MHWHLENESAIGNVGNCHLTVFPGAPLRPAEWRHESKQQFPWEIAAISPCPSHDSRPEEIYVRGTDLIVRYQQSHSDAFAYQLDWHLQQPGTPFVAAVELWISVQTDLLDTQPELEVACNASQGQLWQVFEHQQLSEAEFVSNDSTRYPRGPAGLLYTSNNAQSTVMSSGLWLIEPSDQYHSQRRTTDEQSTQRVRVFGQFMEKGVIRRARMRFLLAPGAITIDQIRQAYRDLADSPLPLTA